MMKWFWDAYTTDPKQRHEIYASPLLATAEQLKGLPPALVQTAEKDVLRDEGEAYARKLDAAGVSVVATRYNGMVIGALIALRQADPPSDYRPFAQALANRATRFSEAFRRVVFAQVRIAALNAALTAVYLMIVLPLLGIHLPLIKTMIAVTFVAGLIPVVGNLISNVVIVVVSLSVSPYVALGSLIYLVAIHKLEYFLNARIVGRQIEARAWELLLAMPQVGENVFQGQF